MSLKNGEQQKEEGGGGKRKALQEIEIVEDIRVSTIVRNTACNEIFGRVKLQSSLRILKGKKNFFQHSTISESDVLWHLKLDVCNCISCSVRLH